MARRRTAGAAVAVATARTAGRPLERLVQAGWANRRHLPYAAKILQRGVCDGCALGAAGFHDWTIAGVHLCPTRFERLGTNTADAFDPGLLADVARLTARSDAERRALGRLGYPMRRRRGEPGFTRIGWGEALGALADGIRRAGAARTAIYLTSRGLTNETYYVAAKAARAMGVANVDSAARRYHAPSTLGLEDTIGVAASTCSLQDVVESDLIVLWGSSVVDDQPAFTTYLYLAKVRGARVVVVSPHLEADLLRYCDLHLPMGPAGDGALANAVLQRLIDRQAVDRSFVAAHTEGWAELEAALATRDPDGLLAAAGVTRGQLEAFVDEYVRAKAAVLVWSLGISPHGDAVNTVKAIVNVALARGNVGRDGAGLMPIRADSGGLGAVEMGAYATAFPGGEPVDADGAAALGARWGFAVPAHPGLTAGEQVEAAERGELDVLLLDGATFLDVVPDPGRVAAALENVPLRAHQDIVLTGEMLVPGDDVILLPAATRYEQEGGGTVTTVERRVAFSPEIPRQVGEARSEWRIFAELARRVRSDRADRFAWPTPRDLRVEMTAVVPAYAGIEDLADTGDAIQWGGRHLCAGGVFPTPSGRGRFSVLVAGGADHPPPGSGRPDHNAIVTGETVRNEPARHPIGPFGR